jgi:membrane protein EpsK
MNYEKKNQTKINFITNIVNLIVNLILAVFYIPYLVNSLGIYAYGIIPLALIVNQYIKILTTSLTGALTRFYSVAVNENDFMRASKYLSSSLVALIIITAVILPFLILFSFNVNSFFNISYELLEDSQLLFLFTFLSFVISLFSSLINITLYANNRLDKINFLSILRILIKFFLVLVLFESIDIKVYFVGLSGLITEVFILIISYIYFRQTINKEVKISFKFYDKIILLPLLSMTTWVIIHQIGDSTLYRIDNVLVNIFFSTKESGILGAITELGNYLLISFSVFSSLFGPLILIAYSESDHKKVKSLFVDSSFSVGVISALMVGLIAGFSNPILNFWLGHDFAIYGVWLKIKLLSLPFFVSGGVFAFVYRSWNKVKWPAIYTLSVGLLNFVICYIILYYISVQWVVELVLLINLLLTTIQCYVFNAIFVVNIYPDSRVRLIKNFKIITLVLVGSLIYSEIINDCFEIDSIFYLAAIFMLSFFILLILVYLFLGKENRKIIISLFKSILIKN